jgi:sugar O-acyltransferase (sialic acid O-acetyltransferase NeuD family)
VIADAASRSGYFAVAGWIDDVSPEREGEFFDGAPILGGKEYLPRLVAEGTSWLIVAVGECAVRARLAEVAVSAGLRLATVIHPAACVARTAAIGPGTFVAAGAVVASGARLGANVIVNHGATVDHDCELADAVHVCPGVHLAGNVQIGARAWIGIGTSIVERVSVGTDVMVGAGSVVVQDLPAGIVAYGCPARIIRSRKNNA